jgi:hypothetical protein
MNEKPSVILKMIGQLELKGYIIRHMGNKVSLNSSQT